MTAQQPPRNSQANEAANARSCNDSRAATAACPLMSLKLQIVPLRYGIVEHLDPSSEVAMPYELQSRPMGVRLLRNGFLYVIEEQTGFLHEYEVTDGALSKLLWQDAEVSSNTRTNSVGPAKLVFPRQSTLHVAYSEVQWTAAKCSQVLGSADERRHFMQQVNPGSANPATGGTHLMTWQQTERWLAEVAENQQEVESPELPEGADPDENLPYLWETPSLFKETSIDALKGQVLAEYKDDSLCLVIRDDIGVMRDLANFQDKVVGWIDDWANGGAQPAANERDYMLACYIESLSQVTAQGVNQLAELTDQPEVQAMFEDLENLPEPERGQTRQAIADYLNEEAQQTRPYTPSDPHPADLKVLYDEIHAKATRTNAATIIAELNETKAAYYAMQKHFEAIPDSDFVNTHRGTLTNLKKEQNQRVAAILEGSQFGQRGINDLINRPAMDAALERDRTNLSRWNALLDKITEDRLEMVTNNRFHLAAWYYDSKKAEQIGLAFSAQYGCFKDICRSDTAIEAIHKWLEEQPDYDRPLFYTLPLDTQTKLSVQLASLHGAGYSLVSRTSEWVNKLRDIENPYLPALDQLPEATRIIGESAHQTLNPALAHGLSRTLDRVLRATSASQIPTMEALFELLPKADTLRLFDATRKEGVSFVVGDSDDLRALRQNIDEVLTIGAERNRLNKQHKTISRSKAGHKSERAIQARAAFVEVRNLHSEKTKELFKRVIPISELPESNISLTQSSGTRPILSLTLTGAKQDAVAGMWRSLREGYLQAPRAGILGDGAGLLIAITQAVNLWAVLKETLPQEDAQANWSDFRQALVSTAAAGFMAAQAIIETALTARSTALIRNLQLHAVDGIHVMMGKLHTPLSILGYGFSFFASINSLRSHNTNWLEAVRKGNTAAQQGATVAMAGSTGLAGASTYGFIHSVHTGAGVIRGGSLAIAGARLSTVFFRFNLAGALFTVAELGGTWWYNRQNISRHDAWLQITPWSRNAENREYLSLAEYQERLQSVLQSPTAQLRHTGNGQWAKDILGLDQDFEVDIILPGVSRSTLLAPFGSPAPVQISLAGYRIVAVGRRRQTRWHPISEDVIDNTSLFSEEPLQLTVGSTAFPESSARLELLLIVRIETLEQNGQYQAQEHNIRLRTHNEGSYLTSEDQSNGIRAPRIALDPHFVIRQGQE